MTPAEIEGAKQRLARCEAQIERLCAAVPGVTHYPEVQTAYVIARGVTQDIESLRRMDLSVALEVVAKADVRIVSAMRYAMELATQMQAEMEERGIQQVLVELRDLETRAGAVRHRYVTLVAERDRLRNRIAEHQQAGQSRP